MTRQEKYEADQLIEAGVADFLDQHFYSKFKDKVEVHRWSDKAHQFAGIDITLKNTNFDEKVKIHGCLNQAYPYPSFEVSLVNKAGFAQDGWFVSPLSTDYYTILGVYSYNSERYNPKDKDTAPAFENAVSASSEISAVDVLWVKKSELVGFVQQFMTMQQLKSDAESLRAEYYGEWNGKARKTYQHRQFWLTYSPKMSERPVNLVTTRENLMKLPHTRHFIATRESVVVL